MIDKLQKQIHSTMYLILSFKKLTTDIPECQLKLTYKDHVVTQTQTLK